MCIRDSHCGLRGFDRAAILDLDLQAPGMEFASEMVVKATVNNLKIIEVPTTDVYKRQRLFACRVDSATTLCSHE